MNNKITFNTIIKLIFYKKPALIWGQVAIFMAMLVSVPIPLMLPRMVDEVLLHKPGSFVLAIDHIFGKGSAFYYIALVGLGVIILRILSFAFTALISKIFTKISKFATFEIRKQVLNHLKKVCMNEYEMLGSGKIAANLITDVETLDAFVVASAAKFASAVLTLLAIAIVLLVISPVLGLMILVSQPLIILLSKKIASVIGGLKKEENKAIASFQDNISQTLELFGQIKASNKEDEFFEKAIEKADHIQKTSNAFGYKSDVYLRFSFLLFLISFAILQTSGLILVSYHQLSIGLVFAMFGYIWFLMTPIQDILSIQYSYANAKVALKRLNTIFDLQAEVSGDKILDTKNGLDICIKDLSFSYLKDKPLLQNISFNIKHKEKIALIGSSGSGKTTLAQVLAGFYHKDSGEIFYNDVKLSEINKKSLRESIFLVLQMPILFNDTLRFNITMGNKNISDKEIMNAIKTAQLYEIVEKMPKKLDTLVGKNGAKLSGGQRQRLSVARMLIANPSLVIFDESTSALDVHTEAKLFLALKPILEEKTVITIAHRLSTVKNADMIYVLEDGKIVQEGKHSVLEQEDGHYLNFIKQQLI